MKCPKCGFVSYAGLEQCKKCGYPFVKAVPKASSRVTSLFPAGVSGFFGSQEEDPPKVEANRSRPIEPEMPNARPKDPAPASPSPPEVELRNVKVIPPHSAPEPTNVETRGAEVVAAAKSSPKNNLAAAVRAHDDEQSQDWREELSERVESYRKRRGHLQPGEDSAGSLDLDLSRHDKAPNSPDNVVDAAVEGNLAFDLEIGESDAAPGDSGVSVQALPFKESDDEMERPETRHPPEDEVSIGEPPVKSSLMEIEVDSPTGLLAEEDTPTEGIYLAQLSRRTLAGLADALWLILGAAEFALIFWRFCGPLSLDPLNAVVLGLAAAILVFSYFAVFTAITSATPGLLWMRCDIRNLRGEPPSLRECCWRAFGVLVSLSALMLGFVWACVDSDGLTWHDRMSGTVIVEEPNG